MYVGSALLCVNLVWIYKRRKHQLYTQCVYSLHCVPKYSKQETLLVAMFVFFKCSTININSYN